VKLIIEAELSCRKSQDPEGLQCMSELPLQPSRLLFLLFFADLNRALDYVDQCPKESFCQIALICKHKGSAEMETR